MYWIDGSPMPPTTVWSVLAVAFIVWVAVAAIVRARPDRWMMFQFTLTVIAGIACSIGLRAWVAYINPQFMGPAWTDMAWGGFAGFWVARGITYLLVWQRFGRDAAHSMRLLD